MEWATQRFQQLDSKKAKRIIDAAVSVFAEKGYDAANTNEIAKAAGIAVGSLFQYFKTKENLFRYVIQQGAGIIETDIGAILKAEISGREKLHRLMLLTVRACQKYPEYQQLYHEITATGNRDFIVDIARELESYAAAGLIKLIKQGRERGDIRTDLPAEILAFTVDNAMVMMQYSLSTPYFKGRAQLYQVAEPNEFAEQMTEILWSALEKRS
ncbi:TetR/AcrR family transcriptional regulator [Varibaculum massiliense]|uniref:TetR/AcrR family transcriptional regulator n=1 Tax=Varibaculum massiliense TaxID=1852372 RepID=UPI0008D9C09B|nr:TetR/AcrR family transcriptional regulator [Varibaculum massiliense]